jgi:hypothetical protein
MFFDRLYYEIKLLGKRALLTPIILLLAFVVLAFVLQTQHVDPARTLLGGIEMMLPIAIGTIIGTVVAHDPALELHLTLVHKYHMTGMLRLLCILSLAIALALIYINSLAISHMLYLPLFMQSWTPLAVFVQIQLIWLAPLLWCMSVGFCFSLLLQSRTAGVALLGGIWIAEIVFKDFIAINNWLRPVLLFPFTLVGYPATHASQAGYNLYFLNTRFELIGMALVFFFLGWLLLRNTEHMLKGITAE